MVRIVLAAITAARVVLTGMDAAATAAFIWQVVGLLARGWRNEPIPVELGLFVYLATGVVFLLGRIRTWIKHLTLGRGQTA